VGDVVSDRERAEAHRLARDTYRELIALRARIDEEIEAARADMEATRRGVRPLCGTEKGYQWHRHDADNWPLPKDDPCGCRAAHAAHGRKAARAEEAA
jgi:hypothetical protein